MTTTETSDGARSEQALTTLEANLSRIEELTQRLLVAMNPKRHVPTSLQGPSADLYANAASAYMAEMMRNPGKIIEQQVAFWGKSVKHYVEAQHLERPPFCP